jgi:hypothetical protein
MEVLSDDRAKGLLRTTKTKRDSPHFLQGGRQSQLFVDYKAEQPALMRTEKSTSIGLAIGLLAHKSKTSN